MRHIEWIRIGSILMLAVAITLTGCGGSSSVGGRPHSGPIRPLAIETTYLDPFVDNSNQTPRWMDIADYLYSSTFRDTTYQYPSDTVELMYTTQESPLRFSVVAPSHALKPNFCYQMKLEGPSQAWSNDPSGADFVNYQFG